ncbi:MAG: phage holin family protein [Paludibacteraceae bacterium]|nr:phage holin family protein [Paludibacteraceae bacterium]
MSKYKWSFANVGGVTRVRIKSAEDVRHLGELDKKMWTVLSCPVNGLEISSDSLRLMDQDGDGQLRLKEVVATADWLCATLQDPQSLFEQSDVIKIENIADEGIRVISDKLQKDGKVALADVQAAIDAIAIETPELPAAPFEADVIAAYKAKSPEYAAYFEQEKLQKLGLATIPEDAPKPGMTEKKFIEMGDQISKWESEVESIKSKVESEMAAAKAEFEPLRKLLLLHRDFYRLLRNFVTLEDFYDNDEKTVASFLAGTLILDQRACKLCIRVNDLAKHDSQAPLSGMYLLYCNCENKKTGKKLQIVAAMTQGEIKNLSVGKNGIFYDNNGLDYDATVFKIIENPISLRQAFWNPYRKMAKWVEDKINKSAAEKDAKTFDDMTAKVATAADPNAEKKSAFDIAKFAGIFAAIGMALGMIGTALASVAKGWISLTWWQQIIVFVCILLIISGPSMIMAWMKLRRRNLAPVLNANGWAINADSIISVPFGLKLTEQVRFPFTKNPAKKNPAGKIFLVILLLIILGLGGFGIYKYITKEEVTAEEVMEATEAEANPAVSLENAEVSETEEGAE